MTEVSVLLSNGKDRGFKNVNAALNSALNHVQGRNKMAYRKEETGFTCTYYNDKRWASVIIYEVNR